MKMADAFTVTMIFVGLMIVLPAVFMLFGALWPSALGRARHRITKSPLWAIGTFLIGLVVAVVFVALTAVLGNANLPWLALPIAAFGLGWAFFGTSALARNVGERLSTPGQPAWRSHMKGSIVLSLSFLVPVLGWLLVFPITLCLGTGAATLSLFGPRKAAPAEEPKPAPASVEKKVEIPA